MEKPKKGRNHDARKHGTLAAGAHQNALPLMEIPPIIQNGYPYQYRYHQSCPALLPLPLSLPLPPPLLVYMPPSVPVFYENNSAKWRRNGQNGLRKQRPIDNQIVGPTMAGVDAVPLRQGTLHTSFLVDFTPAILARCMIVLLYVLFVTANCH